jgi:hypothetical protein
MEAADHALRFQLYGRSVEPAEQSDTSHCMAQEA